MVVALIVACVVLVLLNRGRLTELRKSLDAAPTRRCCRSSTWRACRFGAVIAALPVFVVVRDGLLALPGGPLVSMAVATSVLGVVTASASGALIITLNTFGETYARLAAEAGIDPQLIASYRRPRQRSARAIAAQRRDRDLRRSAARRCGRATEISRW